MRLDDAANIIIAVSTEEHAHKKEKLLFEFVSDNIGEIDEFVALLYGTRLVRPEHIMSAIHHSMGVFPEEFELVEGDPLVPLLASESPREVENDLHIPEALSLVSALRDLHNPPDIRTIFGSIDYVSALALWNRALGEQPFVIRKRLTRAVAHHTGYDPYRLTTALAVEPLPTVIRRALDGTLPKQFRMEPGHPFKGPSYAAWRWWSLPFEETYYEVVKGPRRYAHKTGERVMVFDRVGEIVHGIATDLGKGADCIVEIDERGGIVQWLHTTDDPDLWEKPYTERARRPEKVKDVTHLRSLAQSLEDGEVLRLVDGTRPYIYQNHVGGFILPKRIFELPLLITAAKLESNREWVKLRVEVMDGFEPVKVGTSAVKLKRIPEHPVLVDACRREVWTDLSTPLVGMFHALRCRDRKIEGAHLVRLDTSLGMSDVMQLSEVYEREGDGQKR